MNLKFSDYTGLRKLMRAAYQGRIPDERGAIIMIAMGKAEERSRKYMNSHARRLLEACGV
jgi:hypothetical protein